MNRNEKVVLIGGAGRTGTNVLKKILAQHPETVALPFESRFPVDPDGVAHTLSQLRGAWSPFLAERCFERHIELLSRVSRISFLDKVAIAGEGLLSKVGVSLQMRPYKEWELAKHFPGYERRVNELREDLKYVEYRGMWPGRRSSLRASPIVVAKSDVDGAAMDAFSRFLCNLYADLLRANERSVYVDDNTFNSIYSDVLLDVLPSAKLVNVVRDPRDALSSYLRQRWTPSDVRQAALYHQEVVRAWWRSRERISRSRYIEIRLEDLVGAREVVLRDICDFLEIPFHRNLLKIDLDGSNSGRWVADLPKNWHGWIDERFKEILVEYGYQSGDSDLGKPRS